MASDALEVQISVRLRLPRGLEPSSTLVDEVVAYRVEHGRDHPRATTRIIQWRNPSRKRTKDRQWRTGNQADAWATLGRALKSGRLIIRGFNEKTGKEIIVSEEEDFEE